MTKNQCSIGVCLIAAWVTLGLDARTEIHSRTWWLAALTLGSVATIGFIANVMGALPDYTWKDLWKKLRSAPASATHRCDSC